jgi:hypothetical protein
MDYSEQTSKALGQKGSKWSAEEDEKLVMLYESGLPWVEIAAHFEGRTVGSCQTRYSRALFEGENRRTKWSDEDSLRLKELREKSDMDWVQIATHFEGRAVNSCQVRYYNHLYEGEKRILLPWSDEESLRLKDLKEKSDMRWAQIATHFEGRSLILVIVDIIIIWAIKRISERKE